MDLNKIKYFRSVADHGTISKAGQEMGISQPALSLMIQGLEEELGLQLFERGNRGLRLTEEGKVFYSQAALLKDWERETGDLLEGTKEPRGKISVGTYTTASSYLLAPLLKGFFLQYPLVQISYDYNPSRDILQKVENAQLDCAIISEVPERENLDRKLIYTNEMILVTSHSDKKTPKEVTPGQLQDFVFLSYPLRNDYCYVDVERRFGSALKKCTVPLESESFDTLKQSILSGLGVSFMPEYLVRRELAEKRLKQIKVKGPKIPIQFYFVVSKKRKLSSKLRGLREFMISALKNPK